MIPSDVFFWGSLSLLLGIVGASVGWNAYLLLGIVVTASAVLHLLRQPIRWRHTVLFVALAAFGSWYFHFSINAEEQRTRIPFGEKAPLEGIVRDARGPGEEYRSFTVSLLPPYRGLVRVITSDVIEVRYGDRVEIAGIARPPNSPADLPMVFSARVRVAAQHQGAWLKERLFALKERFVAAIRKFLPDDEGALLAGITVGERSRISKTLKSDMALSGTTHIVALSGYNIAVLAAVIARVLRRFMSRRRNFLCVGLFISAFVLMVGGEASVVRAAIMGLLALLAQELGRSYNPRNAIVLAAACMTLITPTAPAYDLGFQLSFASLVGIVYLAPFIRAALRVQDEGFMSWKFNAITTLAAQGMVLPILLANFGVLPVLGVFANILILQLIPLTMFFGFVLGAAGMLFSYAGFVVAQLAHMLLAFEVEVITLFARISLPVELRVGFATALFYYAFFVTLLVAYGKKISPTQLRSDKP